MEAGWLAGTCGLHKACAIFQLREGESWCPEAAAVEETTKADAEEADQHQPTDAEALVCKALKQRTFLVASSNLNAFARVPLRKQAVLAAAGFDVEDDDEECEENIVTGGDPQTD